MKLLKNTLLRKICLILYVSLICNCSLLHAVEKTLYAYVSNYERKVYKIECNTLTVVKTSTMSYGSMPGSDIEISTNGKKLYILAQGLSSSESTNYPFYVLETTSLTVVQKTNLGYSPPKVESTDFVPSPQLFDIGYSSLKLSPDGKRVYLSGSGVGVMVLDAQTLGVLDKKNDWFFDDSDMQFSSNGGIIYAHSRDGIVAIDAHTNKIIKTVVDRNMLRDVASKEKELNISEMNGERTDNPVLQKTGGDLYSRDKRDVIGHWVNEKSKDIESDYMDYVEVIDTKTGKVKEKIPVPAEEFKKFGEEEWEQVRHKYEKGMYEKQSADWIESKRKIALNVYPNHYVLSPDNRWLFFYADDGYRYKACIVIYDMRFKWVVRTLSIPYGITNILFAYE